MTQALSGDAAPENAALTSAFTRLLHLRGRIVLRHLGLNLLTFFMDYGGTVVNYLVLAAAVLAGSFGHSHSDAIVAISKGSGFTLMVIFGFSQIVDTVRVWQILRLPFHRLGRLRSTNFLIARITGNRARLCVCRRVRSPNLPAIRHVSTVCAKPAMMSTAA